MIEETPITGMQAMRLFVLDFKSADQAIQFTG
jgi:hypothetical protein